MPLPARVFLRFALPSRRASDAHRLLLPLFLITITLLCSVRARLRGVATRSALASLLVFWGVVTAAQEGPRPAPERDVVRGAQEQTTIDAQSLEGSAETETVARGRVELRRGDTGIFAESLRYDRTRARVEAQGGVRLEVGGDRLFGPRLHYDLNARTGEFIEPRFIFVHETQTVRGSAKRIEMAGKNRYVLHGARYTTCRPTQDEWVMWEPPADASPEDAEGYAWQFRAEKIELDYETKEGRAHSMRVRFFETPIAGLPSLSFPLESRRKSGFLAPQYSQSTSRGASLGVPYYVNLMPEMDATLTPVHMSLRGQQLKSDLRYLGRSYDGRLQLDYLARDPVANETRSLSSIAHRQEFTENLSGGIDARRVSDYRYFADFSTQAKDVSTVSLPQEVYFNYGGASAGWGGYGVSLRVQRFQNLQDPQATTAVPPPYHRLPQARFIAGKTDLAGMMDVAVPGEIVQFEHPTLLDGRRLALNPTVAVPYLTPGWQITPKIGFRHVSYALRQVDPGQDPFPGVAVPWASLDAGLAFEREAGLIGEGYVQTLEPRLYYVYVPYRDQGALPLFDTALSDLNFASIFTENRFSGNDRFGDARQVTLAAASRIYGPGGRERMRMLIGQRRYFQGERVGLAAGSPLRTQASSDVLAVLGGRIGGGQFVYDAGAQYNAQDGYMQRYSAALRYAPELAKVVSLSYRYNMDALRVVDLRQADVTGQWPIGAGWYAVGRYNYSLLDRRMLEGLAGFEYNSGCWAFRGVVQQIQTTAQFVSTGIYLQLEFNGLGQFGTDDAVGLLKRTVPGYVVTNPSDPALVPPAQRRSLPFEQRY